MIAYLKDVHGFQDENITILMDDGNHTSPTRRNILQAYRTLVSKCQPGDAVFCHYVGTFHESCQLFVWFLLCFCFWFFGIPFVSQKQIATSVGTGHVAKITDNNGNKGRFCFVLIM